MIGQDRTIDWIKVHEMLQVPDIEEVIHFISSTKQIKKAMSLLLEELPKITLMASVLPTITMRMRLYGHWGKNFVVMALMSIFSG